MEKFTGDYKAEERKMLAGEFYDGFDPYLDELRKQARHKVKALVETRDEPEKYKEAVRNLLGTTTDGNAIIDLPVFFDYGYNTHVGKSFYMNSMGVILDCARVDIGDNVMIGPGVHIYAVEHHTDPKLRLGGPDIARPIRIGNNVWIGGRSIILSGVTIGDNVTVGAGSVVTKDVPDNVVVVGNPARILRHV
ncbi:hypothetical protein LPJ59_004559 [Coemansia sp. RSA 2399]|nr:hypothetical protein LPJ59_004559 [Coemansia sp. RSA 2399]KAJ1891417.1 hypothetical protein LPJ81_005748 [Coemansia sp. IMI 209127]